MVTPGGACTEDQSTIEYQYMPRQLIWQDMTSSVDEHTPQAGIGQQIENNHFSLIDNPAHPEGVTAGLWLTRSSDNDDDPMQAANSALLVTPENPIQPH